MSYSGLEIQLKEFSKSMRGYDTNEVRYFLEDISKLVEALNYELKILKDKLRDKDLLILDYKEREEMLKDTIVTARKITENIKVEAKKEADLIVKEATIRAETIVKDARISMRRHLAEIQKLKKLKIELIAKIKAMLDTHMSLINEYSKDEIMEYNFNLNQNNKEINI